MPSLGELSRWELYRLLSDPVRVRLLALTSAEELSVGELAEVLREGQPKISRHAAVLRDAGLVSARKQGTWVLLRLGPGVERDPVVADAVRAGRASCERDGTWDKAQRIVDARDQKAREFFARGGRPLVVGAPTELSAYLAALASLLPHRRLAVDAGTGDGALLEVLAPVFERVIAVDRSRAQLDLARERVRRRGFDNVSFVVSEIDGAETRLAVRAELGRDDAGADVVFASRVLHHAAAPGKALRALVDLARPAEAGAPGGAVLVLDYAAHDDLELRDAQADLWLGFAEADLLRLADEAGLVDVRARVLPQSYRGDGPDRHLAWLLASGRRGPEVPHTSAPARTGTPRNGG
jgi:ArsR family transcriptional regulator